jgi:3-phenylpropionate/trans-cinnamate dioxygenase ferredoxin reductase subunit
MGAGMAIVGAGECGGRAALALRDNGYQGPVTLIGAEPHLPYERPPLSKETMIATEAPPPKAIATAAQFRERGINFLGGRRAESIDRAAKSVRVTGGRDISYEKLLLATGAVPRRLALAGEGLRIAYLRTYDDALAIRSRLGPGCRVAIAGGGFIGLELAASARLRGAQVTVIEAQRRILMRGVPAEIAEAVRALHESHGVEILCEQGISAIESDDHRVTVTLADGRTVIADFALVGIGAAAATALAEAAGLAVDNGIAVDERLATGDSDIFAAGDCCSFPLAVYGGRRVRLESWRSALEHAALAARNMMGADEPHAHVPWFWSDQYDRSLHIAGLHDEAAGTVRRDLGDGAFVLFHMAADGRLVAASGFGPGNSVARDVRLAEMLIAKRARPAPADLAAAEVRLKKLLAA